MMHNARAETHLVLAHPPHFLSTALGFPHHEHRYSSYPRVPLSAFDGAFARRAP